MTTWLLIFIFSGMHAFYRALFEGTAAWCVAKLLCPEVFNIEYWVVLALFYIPNFFISCFKVYRLFKD